MRALVTGAGGFLGRSIVRRLLLEGIAVRALLRPGRTLDGDVEVMHGDVCDDAAVAAAVRGIDWVIHAAARVATSGTWEEFAEANIRATRRVINAAREAKVRRVVHISSLGVYAVPHDGVTISEDSPYESETEARGHYSRSKLAADRLAMHAARGGAPVVTVRPGLLYGPGKRPALARQSFSAGQFRIILGTPAYRLPMAYVDNVADAVVLAACSEGAAGHAFTIVDENIRQDEYLAIYRRASGERWRPVFLPVGAVAGAAWCLERALRVLRRRSPVTAHQIRRATRSAYFDCTKAQRLLGWQPAVPVAEALQRVFASLHVDGGEGGSRPAHAGVSA